MKTEAMVLDRHGGPEVLERRTIDLLPPGPCSVRVRVHAVAMNHMDLWVRRGGPHFKLEYPHRLGCDIAGVVEELGPGARGVAVGDRVMVQPGLSCGVCRACLSGRDNLCRSYRILGENTQGGYARHINLPDQNLIKIGDALSFTDAAALPLCTLTAWQMVFEKAEVQPGQTVIVHAAGSGVSSIAIKLCKMAGARVIATTGSPDKRERAIGLGADEVIVTSEQDYVAEVRGYLQEDALPDVQFFYPDDCGHQGQTDQPEMFQRVLLEFFRDGIVSSETASWAGVSQRRPVNPALGATDGSTRGSIGGSTGGGEGR